jgi:hypothetical protein
VGLTRANIQSPIHRLQWQFKQWISGGKSFFERVSLIAN